MLMNAFKTYLQWTIHKLFVNNSIEFPIRYLKNTFLIKYTHRLHKMYGSYLNDFSNSIIYQNNKFNRNCGCRLFWLAMTKFQIFLRKREMSNKKAEYLFIHNCHRKFINQMVFFYSKTPTINTFFAENVRRIDNYQHFFLGFTACTQNLFINSIENSSCFFFIYVVVMPSKL